MQHLPCVAQNFLKEPNRSMSPKEGQLIDYNNGLLVVEIMLFPSIKVFFAGRLTSSEK